MEYKLYSKTIAPPTDNSTSVNIASVFYFTLYSIEGVLLVLFNSILIAAVLKNEALRCLKEFVIVSALALAHAISGLGTLCAGLYRIPLVLANEGTLTSRRSCFLKPHNLLWSLGGPLNGIMLLIVSIDRYICVAAPLKYNALRRSYALCMVSVAYGLCMIQFVAFAWHSWPDTEDTESALCLIGSALVPFDHGLWWHTMTFGSILSVLLYVGVIVEYRKRNRATEDSNASAAPEELIQSISRQQKLTRTLSFSCVCTFVFFCLPTFFGNLSFLMPQLEYGTVGVWSWIIANMDSLFSLCIYFSKQREIRLGVKGLLTGKQMPPNVLMWKTNANVIAVKSARAAVTNF